MARRRKGVDLHGWIVLDKPFDMTSNDALSKIKRLLTPKKAGHAGTLDPLATGILPIALGEATKTVPYAMEGAKTYRFAIHWGVSTETLDAEGAVTARSEVRPSAAAIEAALPGLVGEAVMQTPPSYSAIKVDGERAYDLARAGEVVTLEPRPVRIDALSLVATESADVSVFEMRCGKGAYVRAVVRDLAALLGAEGHVGALRRTAVGPFCEGQAIGLAELADLVHKGDASEAILPVQTALDDIPALAVTPDQAADLRQGRAILLLPHTVHALRDSFRPRTIAGVDASRTVVAMLDQQAVALGDVRAGRMWPARVFQL